MRLSRISSIASAFFLTAALALVGAGPAQAAGPAYVALGDSYSSGVGSGGYDSDSGDCYRSGKAYPALWAAAHTPSGFSFMACNGSGTRDVIRNQLGTLGAGTRLVSITVGGNDDGFTDVMTTCVLNTTDACLNRIGAARSYAGNVLPGRLDAVYDAIRAKAPYAHVVVVGYPRFYRLGQARCVGLSEAKRTALNAAADTLDSVIEKRAVDHGFAFADVRGAFGGHELCSGTTWLHSVTLTVFESYHPTAVGQSGGYLPVFSAAA